MKASEFKKRLGELIDTFGDKEIVVCDADTYWYMNVSLDEFNPNKFKAFVIAPSGYGDGVVADDEVEIKGN